MTNLTTARRANATRFTDRIGREVVVQQEVRTIVAMQRVDDLLIVTGAQRGDNQTLCLSSGEQGRTVGARQNMGFGHDVAHLVQCTAVDTAAILHNVRPQNARFQLFQGRAEVFVFLLFLGQTRNDRLFAGGNSGGTLLLVADGVSGPHLLFARRFHDVEQRAVIRRFKFKRLFCGFFGQINDQVDHRLDVFMRKVHRAQHFGFGQLIGFGFHHHHGVFGAGHNEVQTLVGIVAQLVHIIDGRVQDVFTILKANTCSGNRATERRAGNRQRSRGGDHRNDIGVVDQIVAQNRTHHQNFVLEARHKKRTDRTVDQTRGQGFFFGRTRLALEKATGDFARRIVFFLVMNGQREKVLTRLLRLGKSHRRHHRGFAQSGDHGAVGLTGNLARFQRQGLFAPLHGFRRYVKHVSYPCWKHSRALPGLPFSWWPHCHRPQSFSCARGQRHHVSDSGPHNAVFPVWKGISLQRPTLRQRLQIRKYVALYRTSAQTWPVSVIW